MNGDSGSRHRLSTRPPSAFRAVCVLVPALLLGPLIPTPALAQDELLPVFRFQRVNGLPTGEIRSHVVRDHQGYIWIGTLNGLDRYDAYGIKEYRNDPTDPHSLSSNIVKDLFVDSRHRLWVGTFDTGLSLYDALHDRFVNFIPRPGDSTWYGAECIYDISEDRSGNIWLATIAGGVVRAQLPATGSGDVESLAGTIRFTTYSLGTPDNIAAGMLERDDGTFLVGSDSGLILLDPTSQAVTRLHLPDALGRRLDSVVINCMMKDSRGVWWIGSATEGLFRLEPNSTRVTNYRHRKGDRFSLASNVIWDVAEDSRGNLWIGSEEGMDLFSPRTGMCAPYLAIGLTARWPVSWMRLSIDSEGVAWIGTMDGGVHWVRTSPDAFQPYALPNRDRSSPIAFTAVNGDSSGGVWFMASGGILSKIDISTRRVVKRIDVLKGQHTSYGHYASFIDTRGTYWYGTTGLGLFRVDLESGKVRNYAVEAGLGNDRIVISIAQGEGDTLWMAAPPDLMKFDTRSGRFTPVAGVPAIYAFGVMRAKTGKIWMCSERDGVVIVDPSTGTTETLRHVPSDTGSLSNNHVRFMHEDATGRIWVGAGNMLTLWNPASRSFTRYVNPAFTKALFADPHGSDHDGRIWVGYLGAGLSVFDPSTGVFTNYDESGGGPGVFKMANLPDGRVVLAHWAGISILHPDSIAARETPPPLLISKMSINDESAVLPSWTSQSEPLRLPYDQNTLEFEYAAVYPGATHLIEYSYVLEGLENSWVRPGQRRFVRYPGLSPGDYVFRVKAVNTLGRWPEQEIALALQIAPPWWSTWWAYAVYGLLLLAVLYGGYRLRLSQVRLKKDAEIEHFQAEHLAEVNRLKSRFFANISHEFRTPLTLILGPIKKWREKLAPQQQHDGCLANPSPGGGGSSMVLDADELEHDLSMAERNSHRLLLLINQLLDLSKLEAGAMKLRASRMNIVPLVTGLAYSFESSAGLRHIGMSVEVGQEEIEVYCDRDMIEKVLTNFLSNAFKFTPEGGKVTVTVTQFGTQTSQQIIPDSTPPSLRHGSVAITVADTGVGIAPGHLEKIFDRFYQVDESQTREHEGSGIGLALARELVELHHGTIEVKSEVGRGTEFTARLPLGRSHLKDEEIVEAPTPDAVAARDASGTPAERTNGDIEGTNEEGESPAPGGQRPIVLVVEDNADVRSFIRQHLTEYTVLESVDGAQGVKTARAAIPDLIISDVMMPRKDGYELCRILKRDEKTCHIPIILLTAKAASEHKIEGLETGADDYLIKPFEPKELIARVRNLIETRRRLRERFLIPLRPGEVAVTSMDDAFLQKAIALVDERMGDEAFGIDDLRSGLNMSHSQVHRKLRALTNQSPGEFIRYLRLYRAMDLLKGGAGTVAEIAYRVGFSDPSYFSRRFHQQFGVAPSEVRDTLPPTPQPHPAA